MGGGRWRRYNLWEEYFKIHKIARIYSWVQWDVRIWKPYTLALVGRPSLHGDYACMVYWAKGALWRNCRHKQCKTSFSPCWVFLFSRNPTKRFWGLIFWHFWAGRARHPGPPSQPKLVSLEFHNVGGWLTHGDLALDAGVDFLAVAEHGLIPARVRSEWSRHRGKGLSSVLAPASQDSSHVGNAGVGVVSLRGAPLALLTFATAQFKSFFDCGRAVRCLLPLASGRFLHLGYQGADSDAEQLASTDQLFDAALGELHAVALGQPCLLVGDFNVEPTKIPCLAKGISAGLWVDFGEAWALAAGLHPAPTCKRSWTAVGGHRRDFVLGCPLAAAAILSCSVQPDRWIAPHLAVRALFDYGRWESWVPQPVRCTPLWPASWLPIVDKTRGSKSAEVQRVWEVYDERLQFMSRRDALLLDESLGLDDVSMAWTVWSRAAEAALADAYRFSGGPLPSRGLVLGRGAASFRRVQLGEAVECFSQSQHIFRSQFQPTFEIRRWINVQRIAPFVSRIGITLKKAVFKSPLSKRCPSLTIHCKMADSPSDVRVGDDVGRVVN